MNTKGLQRVNNDLIACAYKLTDDKKWGSLGMTPHTIYEPKATFYDAEAAEGEPAEGDDLECLASLKTKDVERGTFTDIYDVNRIGIDLSSEGECATNATKYDEEYIVELRIKLGLQEKFEEYDKAGDEYLEIQSDPAYDDIFSLIYSNDEILTLISANDPQGFTALRDYLSANGISEERINTVCSIVEKYMETYAASEKAKQEFNKQKEERYGANNMYVRVYTADYYYNETGKVGLDRIQIGPVVPSNDGTPGRNIGYLFEGEFGGATYFLHHYVGDPKGFDGHHEGYTLDDYSGAGYAALLAKAQGKFDSESIPMPKPLNFKENESWKQTTYKRENSPNLLVAWDEDHTGYKQEDAFPINNLPYFGEEDCYYYGYDPASGTFRKLSSVTWAKMKEGLAFLVIPTSLFDSDSDSNSDSNSSKALGTFIVGLDDDDDNDSGTTTTGIDVIRPDVTRTNKGQAADVWYTLQGVRLNGKPTAKGVYIHNGRKEAIQ